MGLIAVLLVGAALLATGALALARHRDLGAALVAIPLLAAGAGVALAGVSRLAASVRDPLGGQEFALLLTLAALAGVVLGTALHRPESQR